MKMIMKELVRDASEQVKTVVAMAESWVFAVREKGEMLTAWAH
jgi:hypothetical protein